MGRDSKSQVVRMLFWVLVFIGTVATNDGRVVDVHSEGNDIIPLE